MRISRTMPYELQDCDPAFNVEYGNLVKDIFLYLQSGGRLLLQQYDANRKPLYDPACNALTDAARELLEPDSYPGRPDLCERICEVVKKDPFLSFIFAICKQDCDDWMFVMQHFCRMSSSCPRFCEGLYFYGPSKTGKDALAAAIEARFLH